MGGGGGGWRASSTGHHERARSGPSTRVVGRREQSKLRVMCNFNSSEHIESSSQRSSPSSTRHQHPGAGHAAQRSGVSLTVIGYAVGPGLKPRHPSHNCLVLNMLARDRAQLQKHHTKSGLKKKKNGPKPEQTPQQKRHRDGR